MDFLAWPASIADSKDDATTYLRLAAIYSALILPLVGVLIWVRSSKHKKSKKRKNATIILSTLLGYALLSMILVFSLIHFLHYSFADSLSKMAQSVYLSV